jgi:hypothetical protein
MRENKGQETDVPSRLGSWPEEFARTYPSFMRLALFLAWTLGIIAVLAAGRAIVNGDLGSDAHAYWSAGQEGPVYGRRPGERDAYLYAPVFLTLIRPLTLLPYPGFLALWIGLLAAVLFWLIRPLRVRWAVPIALCCSPELVIGNIFLLLAAAVVLGVRRPEAWVFPILTKVTSGVGFLWFAVRADWRGLARGVGSLALVVGVSYLFEPGLWHTWLRFLLEHRDGTPDGRLGFVLRCALAAALVVVAARRNQPWLLAPAVLLASPVLSSYIALTVLAALPRLMGETVVGPSGTPTGRALTPPP